MPKRLSSEKMELFSHITTPDPQYAKSGWKEHQTSAKTKNEELYANDGNFDDRSIRPFQSPGPHSMSVLSSIASLRAEVMHKTERSMVSLFASDQENLVPAALNRGLSTFSPQDRRTDPGFSCNIFKPSPTFTNRDSWSRNDDLFGLDSSQLYMQRTNDSMECIASTSAPTYSEIGSPDCTIFTPSTSPTTSEAGSRPCSICEAPHEEESSVKHPLLTRRNALETIGCRWSTASGVDALGKGLRRGHQTDFAPDYGKQMYLQDELLAEEKAHQKIRVDLRQGRQRAHELREENRDQKREFERRLEEEVAKSAGLQEEVTRLKALADEQANTIKEQSAEIMIANSNYRRLDGEVATRSAQIYTLQGQMSDLCTQRNTLKHNSEAIIAKLSAQLAQPQRITPTTDLKQLQTNYDRLKRELQSAKAESQELDDSLQDLRAKYNSHTTKFKADLATSKAENSKQKHIIAELMAKVTLLEQDRDLKAPLVKTGVETRLRNLEHARERVSGITMSHMKWDIIETGNRAAHRASAEIDAAMFKAGLVPAAYLTTATETYQSLYQITPAEYPKFSPKGHRLVDCKASMRILLPLNRTNSSARQRAQWKEVEGELYKSYANPTSGVDFETSEGVERQLIKLEALTNEIIQLDRSRNGRRRG